jgi:hypothetical protein
MPVFKCVSICFSLLAIILLQRAEFIHAGKKNAADGDASKHAPAGRHYVSKFTESVTCPPLSAHRIDLAPSRRYGAGSEGGPPRNLLGFAMPFRARIRRHQS